jgi:hypothetical protein
MSGSGHNPSFRSHHGILFTGETYKDKSTHLRQGPSLLPYQIAPLSIRASTATWAALRSVIDFGAVRQACNEKALKKRR